MCVCVWPAKFWQDATLAPQELKMSVQTLKVATHSYDQVRALFDGHVKIEGADATFETAKIVVDIFRGMIQERKYDVSELGFTYYLRTLETDERPFVALPIYLARFFRHSAVYVNKASGITRPEDLVGRTIGEFALFSHDGGTWPKGILADEFGFRQEQNRWVIGALDFPLKPIDFVSPSIPENIDARMAPEGKELGGMLESGEIDALISADVPTAVLKGSPKIGLLFPDYRRREVEYYKRTGVFPIMHTVVVRRELAEQAPDLIRNVYKAFCASKAAMMEQYRVGRIFNHIDIMLPWFSSHFDDVREIFPDDWWPYGVKANKAALETLLRYQWQQGVTKRQLTLEDVFVPDLLDT